MQIIFIIGNGFDKNLGLKTSYQDFYENYSKIKHESQNITKLKKEIAGDYKLWSDLELGLGKHTDQLENLEELDELIFDLKKNLKNYLNSEEKILETAEFNQEEFMNYLSFPEESLLLTDTEKLKEFKKKWSSHQWNMNIVTFNYTKSIEKILNDEFKNLKIGIHDNNAPITLRDIIHIHGFVDREMVLGVNDESQISNSIFHKNQDAIETIVKPHCNNANKNGIDRKFSTKIKNANMICIFGSSIGRTDAKWWEMIGERLKQDCILLIFKKGKSIDLQSLNLVGRQERSERIKFLNLTNLTDEEKAEVIEKIYVGVNTDMFSKLITGKSE